MAKKFEFNANGFGDIKDVKPTSELPLVTDTENYEKNMVVQIPMDLIDIGENIRDLDANDELALSELGASIKEYGQIEPCVVYAKGDRFVLKVGSRRYKACVDAEIPTLKCIIENSFEDERDRIIKQAIENEHRKDMSPREREAYMAALLDLGMTQNDIAKSLHKGKGCVSEALRAYRIREENKDLFAGLIEEPCTRDVYNVGKLKTVELEKVIQEAKDNGGTKKEFKRALQKKSEKKVKLVKLHYTLNEANKSIRLDLDMDTTELERYLAEHLKEWYRNKGYKIIERDSENSEVNSDF